MGFLANPIYGSKEGSLQAIRFGRICGNFSNIKIVKHGFYLLPEARRPLFGLIQISNYDLFKGVHGGQGKRIDLQFCLSPGLHQP